MSFYEKIKEYKGFAFHDYFERVTDSQIERAIAKDRINEEDFLALLSPKAENHLEAMAQKAHDITLRNFGKSIVLYTPMYLANYCENKCAYCGYNVENKIARKKLTFEEVEKEAKSIAATGIKHIIILTGESSYHTPVSYIKDCVKILKKYFSSICIEIYPLEQKEYEELIEAGVDSLTIYQETYNEEVYDKVHLAGPKKNYKYRLDTPERVCKAKIHSVGVGALLGLYEWRSEAFFSGLHTAYIQDKYPAVEISMSVPRIRPHAGSAIDIYEVSDKNIVQVALAYKIFLPRAGINITTRERADFRDNFIPLGVTKMSAGVSTEVGGHSAEDKGEGQFNIADGRSVEEIKQAITKKGYNPVFKDWGALNTGM
ncbi:2-iminoacetate synthase ThiH [Clostridium sp. DJ247]|uniref:2-iminoacetate synthase ThiH n=1 Tax=Clostridium sp. DJ247 TaxID=2726188 RepID=UPI001625F7EE|nr:2-iminoacetate synthase ThiH [Clostridium sp. DJ247]MBC2581840.1 2-iminoacetate synthase ThiH [Clostridium sp. DJ247]